MRPYCPQRPAAPELWHGAASAGASPPSTSTSTPSASALREAQCSYTAQGKPARPVHMPPSTGVLQCGDPTGTGSGGPGYVFPDELSGDERYDAGTVAMANAGPNTNGSQFFMTYEDFPVGNVASTVFGHLDEASRQVVARMGAQGQDGSGSDGSGRPNNEARITAVSVEAGG